MSPTAQSFGEHLLQPTKDRRHRLWCEPTEPPEKALGVDVRSWSKATKPGRRWKRHGTRHGYARPLVVIGATITVRRY